MKLSQFKFKLPEDQIALYPPKFRDECRMMVLHRKTGKIEHKMFKEFLEYFSPFDVFVFNDTKVIPARLYGNKEKTGARIEVFLLCNKTSLKACIAFDTLAFQKVSKNTVLDGKLFLIV